VTKKNVKFLGDSQTVLRSFPSDVRQEMGHALWELQLGYVPAIAKPFGRGVFELRDQSAAGGTFRVVYVLIIKDAVHVLHAFQKKSQRTSRVDVAVIEARLKALKGSLK
jgi:phage-related protein